MDGFLPFSRGTFMLDFVAVAMAGILPLLWVSISMAKKGRIELHRKMQTALGVILFLAVVLFEIDMRLNGWTHLAQPSPFWETPIKVSLYVHLCFSVPTSILWFGLLGWSIWRYETDTGFDPADAAKHRKLGWAAAAGMTGTAITGWIFFYLAFVAG